MCFVFYWYGVTSWRLGGYKQAAAEQLRAVRPKTPSRVPRVPRVSRALEKDVRLETGPHSMQQPGGLQEPQGNPLRLLPSMKSYKKSHWDALSHAESGERSSNTLFFLYLLIMKNKRGLWLLVQTIYMPVHASQLLRARRPHRSRLLSAEYKNLSLSPYTRAGFNKIQGTIIEISTPLSN